MNTDDRFKSLTRRKANASWDRARTLARQGQTDEQIAKELGLPLLNIQAMTKEVRARQAAQTRTAK